MKLKKKVKATKLDIMSTVKIVDIDSVKPWEKNPRKNEKSIDRLIELIKKHGQRTPIVVWDKNNRIYKGNTTWRAMKKMGASKIAVAFTSFSSDRDAVANALGDNKSGEWADWDENALADLLQGEEFEGMKSSEISKITGFADKDLKGLLISTIAMPDVLPDVDLSGDIPDKADYLVIQFKTKQDMQTFKERLAIDSKHPRVVNHEDLMKRLQWIKEEESSLVPDSVIPRKRKPMKLKIKRGRL